ncbi:MAG: HPr family phosphocarrier protein [Xanthomonadales bacterium]|jgi:phosphocarrier protein|nr:HPr family phosphocarrier protein [Xanthomonadales bacterium]
MISAPVTIVNKLGLHARAASRLVNCASEWQAEIQITRGTRVVNAKSIMGVLTLAASAGTEIVIEADGPDEKPALQAVLALIEDGFGEEQ